jgi:hypothetical protein
VSYLVALVASVAMLAGPALAQEKAAAKGDAKAAARGDEKAPGQKARKPSVRMPMYYGEVIDSAQREKIKAILVEFSPKINTLKAQLEALIKERDETVAAVLTPEQAKKVEQLKAAAQAKRKAGKEAKARESATQKDAAPAKESTGRKKSAK